jgi:hypothetical protein
MRARQGDSIHVRIPGLGQLVNNKGLKLRTLLFLEQIVLTFHGVAFRPCTSRQIFTASRDSVIPCDALCAPCNYSGAVCVVIVLQS